MSVNDTTEQVVSAAEDLQHKAGEWKADIKGVARNAGAAADLYVHEYAWTTVALVGVGGLLAGFLLGRSRRNR